MTEKARRCVQRNTHSYTLPIKYTRTRSQTILFYFYTLARNALLKMLTMKSFRKCTSERE